MIGTIYKATNLFTGRVYIGQTTQPFENRKKQHLADKDTWNVFHSAINTWGEDIIEWEVLETYKNKDKAKVLHFLNVAEEFYILKYRSNEERYGYNSTQGGYSSDKFSDQLTARLSATSGKCMVAQYDLDGNHVTTFDSIAEVADFLGGTKRLHRKNLNGYYKGYQWRTISKDGDYIAKLPPYQVKVLDNGIHLLAYSRADGSFVGEFASKKKAMKETGYTEIRVSNISDGKVYQHNFSKKGMVFIRKTSDTIPDNIEIIRPQRKVKDETLISHAPKVYFSLYSVIDGSLIKTFTSRKDAMDYAGISSDAIKDQCRKEEPIMVYKQTRSLWRRDEDLGAIKDSIEIVHYQKRVKPLKDKKRYRVIQYSNDGEFIAIHNSYKDAASLGYDSYSQIYNSCKGKIGYHPTKFQWRDYTDDYPQNIGLIKIRARKSPEKKGCGSGNYLHRKGPRKSSNSGGELNLF